MNKKAIEPFEESMKKPYEDELARLQKSNSNYLREDPKLMVDFGIFEFDVNLDLDNSNNKEFSSWIKSAIESFDQTNNFLKSNIVPNHDGKNIPYITYDYGSITNEFKDTKTKYPNLEFSKTKPHFVHLAGYPYNSINKSFYWTTNNISERYEKNTGKKSPDTEFDTPGGGKQTWPGTIYPNEDMSSFGKNNPRSHLNNFTYSSLNIWNRIFLEGYGYTSSSILSGLGSGASGSLAMNEYGLPIGIYTGSSTSDYSHLYPDSSERIDGGNFSYWVQNFTSVAKRNGKEVVMPAYNLIDDTNRARYGLQKTSYRSNLRILYPNGFENNIKSKKTAIFLKGY
ncbi:conserved domain protein [Mycoplasmopsis alligatoris A21JP2]|uniref:Conserved domain protein n=1 Tax=Mycoplasmopsis alligatoris A21JP2 TaxID=747682 RepID=D4XWT6_9BACT|nr:conserved domain protein [Mycoplasmopsis alligatoris A21JP2]